MLASHNSYKKSGPAIGRFFVGLGDSFDEAKALNYGYKDITEQLELGIRSFEFDLRDRDDHFELTHVPLVDASSQAVRFDMLLDEMMLYSAHQENHMPIIVLIEVKNDWMVLDPKLKTIEESHLQLLDQMIKDKLENRLYLPSDMKSSYDSIKDRIDDIGWPYIKDLYNQFIFVLHPGDYQNLYYDMDQNLESQSMFIGSYGSESYADYASFFIQNDVDLDVIQKLVDDQFIVRTRIDSNLMFSKQRFEDALLSRAQILTTDFSIGRSDLNLEDVIYLDDDEHMITS